ncbi:GNAT family N-acetyltransferase [Nocardioides aquiterrae]|uniref:GNAT family N-acetyltransferase n=1 Tax=Nocardioides aquiterrae TaxID=203799 RepID=A0ABP4FBR2_9ACTN
MKIRIRAFPLPILDRVEDTAEVLVRTPPNLQDYLHLRAASGLTPKSAAEGQGALAGSWCWSVVQRGGRAVAMGRVIGDGGWYFHIADMATLPEHQGRGLGRRVLDDLLAQISAAAPAAPYVTLMADAPGRRLYESMGFVETAPESLGMRLAH